MHTTTTKIIKKLLFDLIIWRASLVATAKLTEQHVYVMRDLHAAGLRPGTQAYALTRLGSDVTLVRASMVG